MSNEWDLHCVTCNESAGFDWNHGNKALADIWAEREKIAVIPTINIPGIEVEVSCSFGGFRLSWIAEHKDHDVRIRDENGRYSTECGRSAGCSACGHGGACRLPVNHPGECSPILPDAHPMKRSPR